MLGTVAKCINATTSTAGIFDGPKLPCLSYLYSDRHSRLLNGRCFMMFATKEDQEDYLSELSKDYIMMLIEPIQIKKNLEGTRNCHAIQ